jgi:hypothetical protein
MMRAIFMQLRFSVLANLTVPTTWSISRGQTSALAAWRSKQSVVQP